jgi:hypothetical protein
MVNIRDPHQYRPSVSVLCGVGADCLINPNQLKNMKFYLITATMALLSFSCERTETTVLPAAEKETVIIKPAPKTEKKTEKTTEIETTLSPDGITTERKETTVEEK